ncbi:MAG: phosphoesterase, partial [Alphaproteobacteria bacterium PA3]
AERMILPAFGSLTGGMDAGAQEILAALQPARTIEARMHAKDRIARFPLWQAAG